MQVRIVNAEGREVGSLDVLARWEGRRVTTELLQQAVVMARANARIPWAHTKGRGDVRGGGRKPWRQKGTGRARHGSIRSPLWKGGGTTFGPHKARSYEQRMPQAMRRTALAMALLTKVRDAELQVIDHFPEIAKTSACLAFLQNSGVGPSVLVVPPPKTVGQMLRACGNLQRVVVKDPRNITAADVLSSRRLLVSPETWTMIEQRLSVPSA